MAHMVFIYKEQNVQGWGVRALYPPAYTEVQSLLRSRTIECDGAPSLPFAR
jgi:hypothetical protein